MIVHIIAKEIERWYLCSTNRDTEAFGAGWSNSAHTYTTKPTCETCILLAFQYPECVFEMSESH